MATPSWIRKMLDLRGIPYEEMHHPEVYTAQEVAQCEHFSGHRVAKVVVLMADGRPVEVILPASRRVNLQQVRTVLAAHEVHFASEKEMEKSFPGCEVGAIPALRQCAGIDVLMDRSLTVEGDILFQAGTHTDAIRLSFREWYEMVHPQVATLSEPPAAAHA